MDKWCPIKPSLHLQETAGKRPCLVKDHVVPRPQKPGSKRQRERQTFRIDPRSEMHPQSMSQPRVKGRGPAVSIHRRNVNLPDPGRRLRVPSAAVYVHSPPGMQLHQTPREFVGKGLYPPQHSAVARTEYRNSQIMLEQEWYSRNSGRARRLSRGFRDGRSRLPCKQHLQRISAHTVAESSVVSIPTARNE